MISTSIKELVMFFIVVSAAMFVVGQFDIVLDIWFYE